MNTFTFNSRETYIAWRADWRNRYNQMCKDIRQAKHNIANANRAGNLNYTHLYARNQLHRNFIELFVELDHCRQEAQRQYLASKNAIIA